MLLMLLMNSAENQVEYGELQKSVKHISGINYFRKKNPSWIFDRVLNTPPEYFSYNLFHSDICYSSLNDV